VCLVCCGDNVCQGLSTGNSASSWANLVGVCGQIGTGLLCPLLSALAMSCTCGTNKDGGTCIIVRGVCQSGLLVDDVTWGLELGFVDLQL
jgi:hypothetical protein